MDTLITQARQHLSATIFFGCYVLVWLGLEKVVVSTFRHLSPNGECSNLMGYPIVLGVLFTLAYCFFLLLRGWWNKESRRFYFSLLLAAIMAPVLAAFIV